MTGHQLAALLLSKPDLPVTVAGHGALFPLACAAGADDGTRVLVLYVEQPAAPELVLTSEVITP